MGELEDLVGVVEVEVKVELVLLLLCQCSMYWVFLPSGADAGSFVHSFLYFFSVSLFCGALPLLHYEINSR